MTDHVVKDLRAARAKVERGWSSCGPWDGEDGVCGHIALHNAVTERCQRTNRDWDVLGFEAAMKQLEKFLPPEYNGIVARYNDARGTTQQDMLNLYDKALADAGGLG